MRHIERCLDEITAEIIVLLDKIEPARALQQLDDREARGETLTIVDATVLRQRLTAAVADHPMMQALHHVGALRQLMLTAVRPITTTSSAQILPFRTPPAPMTQYPAPSQPSRTSRYRAAIAACFVIMAASYSIWTGPGVH